jgi:hypothetical protein
MAGFWRQPQQAEYLPEDFKPLDYSRKDSWHACYAQDGGRNLTAWVPTVGTPVFAGLHISQPSWWFRWRFGLSQRLVQTSCGVATSLSVYVGQASSQLLTLSQRQP